MATKPALQRVQQKLQIAIFIPAHRPQTTQTHTHKAFVSMRCLAPPCHRQRGTVMNSFTSTTLCQPKHFAKADILPYSVVGKRRHPANTIGLSPHGGFINQKLEILQVFFPEGYKKNFVFDQDENS